MDKQTYTYIDLSYLYEIGDGETEFIREMLSDYIEKLPAQFAGLQQAVADQNFEQAHFDAHKVKSSFQFVGVKQLVDLAANIEKVSKTADAPSISNDLALMEPIVGFMLDELKHHLSVLSEEK